MAKRKIIKIDEIKCNGCGLCIPNCPEGAIQMIDNKARLISDLFCDGLGACIGHCPEGAIKIEEREAEPYDERKVMKNIVKQGENVIKAHLDHLKDHGQGQYLKEALDYIKEKGIKVKMDAPKEAHSFHGCPGSRVMDLGKGEKKGGSGKASSSGESQLRQWPVQITLVPPFAPYLNNSDLLVAADCVPFAYAGFHDDLLKGKTLLIGCPKLDDVEQYKDKFTQIFKQNNIKSVTYAHMEVPCCFGLVGAIQEAIADSGHDVPFKEVTISIGGERM